MDKLNPKPPGIEGHVLYATNLTEMIKNFDQMYSNGVRVFYGLDNSNIRELARYAETKGCSFVPR